MREEDPEPRYPELYTLTTLAHTQSIWRGSQCEADSECEWFARIVLAAADCWVHMVDQ